MPAPAALLGLADARLPSGGHAHSGGVEEAIRAGLVSDLDTLTAFLRRRLRTTGLVSAGLAAAACGAAGCPTPAENLALIDAEADARTPSPAQRAASRTLGRGLARLGRVAWPHPVWHIVGDAPHQAVALGAAASAAGLGSSDAAAVAAYLSVTGPSVAAQRLLGLDPVSVAAAVAGLAGETDRLAVAAGRLVGGDPGMLPAENDVLLDMLAERQALRKDRLFAS
jgi:urease accessory protein